MHADVVYPWYSVQRGGHIHEPRLTEHRTRSFTFPDVVYPWYPVRPGGHIHEARLADHRVLSFTFANADGSLVPIPAEVVRVMETLSDSEELHERINVAARIAADQR